MAETEMSKVAILLKWTEKNPDRSKFLVWSERSDGSVELACKCEKFRANFRVNAKNSALMGDYNVHQKECRLLMSFSDAAGQVSCQG